MFVVDVIQEDLLSDRFFERGKRLTRTRIEQIIQLIFVDTPIESSNLYECMCFSLFYFYVLYCVLAVWLRSHNFGIFNDFNGRVEIPSQVLKNISGFVHSALDAIHSAISRLGNVTFLLKVCVGLVIYT